MHVNLNLACFLITKFKLNKKYKQNFNFILLLIIAFQNLFCNEKNYSKNNVMSFNMLHLHVFVCICTDMPLERKTPIVYPDGTYEIVREEDRGNVLVIANLTQNGLTGMGSVQRTAFFTFFGQLVFLLSQCTDVYNIVYHMAIVQGRKFIQVLFIHFSY